MLLTQTRRFATAARVSDINLALYRTFAQPLVRSMVGTSVAEWMHQMHPLRLQYEALSSQNPLMATLKSAADQVEENRKPVAKDNPFLAFQEQMSKQIVHALDSWRDALTQELAEALQAELEVEAIGGVEVRRRLPPAGLPSDCVASEPSFVLCAHSSTAQSDSSWRSLSKR